MRIERKQNNFIVISIFNFINSFLSKRFPISHRSVNINFFMIKAKQLLQDLPLFFSPHINRRFSANQFVFSGNLWGSAGRDKLCERFLTKRKFENISIGKEIK